MQNIVQGTLVNGTLGKVVEFLTPLEAAKKGIRAITAEGIAPPSDMQYQASNRPQTASTMKHRQSDNLWPVVSFESRTSAERNTLLCTSQTFEIINAEGQIEATRTQVSDKVKK